MIMDKVVHDRNNHSLPRDNFEISAMDIDAVRRIDRQRA